MDRSMNRPQILIEMSVSQMNDLEDQFAENDRDSFDTLTQSFGWSTDQADDVWNWFNQRPPDEGDLEPAVP